MKTAHYFASKNTKFVKFGKSGTLDRGGISYPVSGKKEARSLAAKFGATPWNF